MSKAACIAAKATGYIGMPYRLGEEGPYQVGGPQTSALDIDCSGLVYALMQDCDVRLDGKPFPRETADDYWRRATRLTHPERVGDMCWFPRTGAKTHIALYIGNGKTIEAGYHGPNNQYPGHGYVGTCTVAQMDARGAVWGRIMSLDIYQEDDMTPDEVRAIVREEIDIIYSPDVAAAQKALEDAKIIGRRHDPSKAASVGYVDLLLSRVLRLLRS
ncbi:MAG: NlpC/P60 family protein [Armatimonadia bacterium]